MSYPSDDDPRWERCGYMLAASCRALIARKDGQSPVDSLVETALEFVAPIVAAVNTLSAAPGAETMSPGAWLTNYSITVPLPGFALVVIAAGLRGRAFFDAVLHECGHAQQGLDTFFKVHGRGPTENEAAPYWVEYIRDTSARARYEGEAEGGVAEFNVLGRYWPRETGPDGREYCAAADAHGAAFAESLRPYGLRDDDRALARDVYDSRAVTALRAGVPSSEPARLALAHARTLGLLPTETP